MPKILNKPYFSCILVNCLYSDVTLDSKLDETDAEVIQSIEEQDEFSISEFLRFANESYEQVSKLIDNNLLEVTTSLDKIGRLKKRITARSAVYYLRRKMSGEEIHIDVSSQKDPVLISDEEYFDNNSEGFAKHKMIIGQIETMDDEEVRYLGNKIDNALKGIQELVAPTPMMARTLEQLSNTVTKKNINKFSKDRTFSVYRKQHNELIELYQKNDSEALIKKIDSMHLKPNVILHAAAQLKNYLWDMRFLVQEIKWMENSELNESIKEQKALLEDLEKESTYDYKTLEQTVSKKNMVYLRFLALTIRML